MTGQISKVLVANRGEIAIRAFRAAYEMGIATVAVYPHEDRNSLHRLKADESYQIGDVGHPVRAYLSVDEMIRVATQAGADAAASTARATTSARSTMPAPPPAGVSSTERCLSVVKSRS